MNKTYIAGPMSGCADLNFPAFNKEAANQRSLGHSVLNPAEINCGEGEIALTKQMTKEEYNNHWLGCMRRDINALMGCDRIVMLDGWTASRGATLEHYIAVSLGYEIVYLK